MSIPILYSDRLQFKPLSLEHLSEEYVSWMNDLDVIKYLESGGNYTLKQLQDFLKCVEKRNILFWAIHIKETGKHIGNIKIDPINKRHGLGEYGILLGCKNEWGKGFAKEATKRVLEYCFNEMNIRKITLGVIEDNIPAYNLYRNLGFDIEGILIKHGLYEGKYCNVVRMGLFNSNFVVNE